MYRLLLLPIFLPILCHLHPIYEPLVVPADGESSETKYNVKQASFPSRIAKKKYAEQRENPAHLFKTMLSDGVRMKLDYSFCSDLCKERQRQCESNILTSSDWSICDNNLQYCKENC